MKATVKYYESGFSGPAPEIDDLEETMEVNCKEELVLYAKYLELPENAEYAYIYYDGAEEPIAVTRNGIRDMSSGDWLVEPSGDADD